MQSTVTQETADQDVLASVGQAARDAASKAAADATAGAAKLKDAMDQAGPKALKSLTSLAYSTGYVCAYGIVYAAVFGVRMLPKDNAFMRGCTAGSDAAIDELNRA